ncbi:5-oxoprolinase/urea amidolyase family protein [Arachnia propionica]|uniref:5-oxoprolinase/urea amidolyase family protein n=1 Tax=Arachnia propionica TaxID=1750 RepID=A0A3P1TB64_9ACTN|nr:urea amidolyase family protein [Arachnia propionica]RRD06672.1 5-oxoprolinase/urea amidolyase family protein [Arachnia propionica]
MRLLACGERATLVELGDLTEVLAAEARLRGLAGAGEAPWDRVVDVVAAQRTVLLVHGPVDLRPAIARALAGLSPELPRADREVVIDVVYDGEDLAEVSELTGLSPAEVIAAHTGTPWRVAFGGFAPGFAYLIGGDPRLRVPRRSSPRPRVPAGSVGLADQFSGVYPTASPGGWQLIGRTEAPLFDPDAEPPALLGPGTTVRFRAVEQLSAPVTPEPETVSRAGRALGVERTLFPITAQDRGRPGLAAVGVGTSGAADRGAYRQGALLVGNRCGEAALEITLGQCILRALGTLTLALTGAPCPADIDGYPVPMDHPLILPDGARLTLAAPSSGLRTYVSVAGGIDVPTVLGSRSFDTLGRLGPEPFGAGALIPVGKTIAGWGRPILTAPPEQDGGVLHYVPGPRDDWVEGLAGSRWQVSPEADRVGVRLLGSPLARRVGELPSEPVVAGAIQVPPSGEPVLFLADHPLTGGYPVAGVLTEESIDEAAQLGPGENVVLLPVGDR